MEEKAFPIQVQAEVSQMHKGPSTQDRKAQLEYLSGLLPEMRKLALSIDEATLAYLLEMAMLEAQLQLELELEAESE